MQSRIGMVLFVAACVFMAGCSPGPEPTKRAEAEPHENTTPEMGGEEASGTEVQDKELWMQSTRETLEHLKRKVAELKPAFNTSKEHLKVKYDHIVADLKSGIQNIEDRLDHVQISTADDWSNFKTHTKLAVQDLEELYKAAVAAMKDPDAPADADARKEENSQVKL